MSDESIWRDAEVGHADWKGTAQLDERRTAGSIEEIVGLPSDKWLVIGLDIGGGEHAHSLRIVAVDRSIVPDESDALSRVAAENGGEIPVTEFLVHDADPYAVLLAMTHMFKFRLRRRGAGDLPIRVVGQSDAPFGWTDS